MGNTDYDGFIRLAEKLALHILNVIHRVEKKEISPREGHTQLKEVLDEINIHIGNSQERKEIFVPVLSFTEEACQYLLHKMS